MAQQSEKLEFILRTSIFDRPRKLTLDPLYLEFDDKDTADSPPTRFDKADIDGIRYGVKWISGYNFTIGRICCIDLKNKQGHIIKLRLKTIYGIRKKQLNEKYVTITNTLLRYYFTPIAAEYIRLFKNNQPIDLLNVSINAEGVLFDEKIGRISWNFLGTRRYRTYYTLYSDIDPNQYKAFEYLHHWNAALLQSVIESILNLKFPTREI